MPFRNSSQLHLPFTTHSRPCSQSPHPPASASSSTNGLSICPCKSCRQCIVCLRKNFPYVLQHPLQLDLPHGHGGQTQGGTPYTHFLFVSRIYRLTSEEQEVLMATAPAPKKKKQKATTGAPGAPTPNTGSGTFSFHPEDEYIQKVRSPALCIPL
jgi:hypothetical protein